MFLFVSVLILLALHWLGWLKPVESGVTYILRPIVGGMHVVNTKVGTGFKLIGGIGRLAQENKELTTKLEKAEGQIALLNEMRSEIDSLRKRLKAPLPAQMQTTMAGVIGHDGVVAAKSLVIDAGAAAGIAQGDAVLSPAGSFIGRVSSVSGNSSEVMLVTDDHSVVPARVAESRASGLLKGELGLGLKITDIPQQDTIKEGDLAVTSGLSGDLPRGLAIGVIETIRDEDNALFQVARLRPVVDVVSLEFVYVVTDF